MLTHKNLVIIFSCVLVALLVLNRTIHIHYVWFLLLALLFLSIEFWGAYFVQSGFHIKTINNISTSQKVVAITFDDGPAQHTSEIIQVLDKYNVKATFFCIGKNINGKEDVVRLIHSKGHTIGNHSYSHSYTFDFNNTQQMVDDLMMANTSLKNVTGNAPIYFRPPYGVTTPSLARACKQLNFKVIGWNIRSLDTVIKEKNKIIDRVTKKIKPGSIILLHDTVEEVATITEGIIQYLNENNYKVIPLNELIELNKNA